jgi:hypothetical protein
MIYKNLDGQDDLIAGTGWQDGRIGIIKTLMCRMIQQPEQDGRMNCKDLY